MSGKRITAVIAIYIVTSCAWLILGAVNQYRSQTTYSKLEGGVRDDSYAGRLASVQDLWGEEQTQSAPKVWTTHLEKATTTNEKGKKIVIQVSKTDPVNLASSRIDTGIELDPRRKGLLWYSTYRVKFGGDYTFKNEFPNQRKFYVNFIFPVAEAIYDDVSLTVNGKDVDPTGDLSQGVKGTVTLKPGEIAKVHMSYGSQGMDSWNYKFSQDASVSNVRDFEASVSTNTGGIDFPPGCVSPNAKKEWTGDGWNLKWKYANLVSGNNIGITLPKKLNPGPFAAKLSFFAPVSLLFFFAVLLIIGAVKGVRLHPMHYVFLAAAFFSFHLLFSYLVDHVVPFYSFLISSAVSLVLVITYLRLVTGWKFAVLNAGLWQFAFLVLFTYAFFFEGYTGLTITIGAILTLAAMMQITGRVNWDKALADNGTKPQP